MVLSGTNSGNNDNDNNHTKQPKMKAERIHLSIEAEQLGIMPWFSYSVKLPVKPVPPVRERPHIQTTRLVVRPITIDDLEQFHDLRRRPEVQIHCKLSTSESAGG